MRAFLDGLPRGGLREIEAAVFDTRYPGWRLLTGAASVSIARVLKRKGARLVAGPESFFIERDVPPPGQERHHDLERLMPGEAQRAGDWARRFRPVPSRVA